MPGRQWGVEGNTMKRIAEVQSSYAKDRSKGSLKYLHTVVSAKGEILRRKARQWYSRDMEKEAGAPVLIKDAIAEAVRQLCREEKDQECLGGRIFLWN